jgi:uncharacterized protein (DUF3084 family)
VTERRIRLLNQDIDKERLVQKPKTGKLLHELQDARMDLKSAKTSATEAKREMIKAKQGASRTESKLAEEHKELTRPLEDAEPKWTTTGAPELS